MGIEKLKAFFARKNNWLILLFILLGTLVRVYRFGALPIGLNQDEAFAGYEAFSLANYGVDTSGYHNPVYFVAWGSGMNVLESYLAIPFIKIFGLSVYTIRLPQLLCALACLPVLYLLLREMTNNERIALIGLGLLALSPWHIMLSRWGLESNLAPAFLLFSFFFFVKGVKKNAYFILSAFFYGVTLYAYAITWAVVPLTVCCNGLYLVCTRQKLQWRYVLIAAGVLFLLALPLLLFVMVNNGWINEIKTSFISIPKMLVMRDSEIKLSNLVDPDAYYDLIKLMAEQDDGLLWNSTRFGFFYKISIPFILFGVTKLIMETAEGIRRREFRMHTLILISFVCSLLSAVMLTGKNVNRINAVHMYTLLCAAIGVDAFVELCKDKQLLKNTLIVCYALCFAFFCSYYFGDYNQNIANSFRYGAEDAVRFVNEKEFQSVNVDEGMYYPQLLFYDQTPTDEFLATVEYRNYPAKFLSVEKFTKYTFGVNYNNLDLSYDGYIIKTDKRSYFEQKGFEIEEFGYFSVAYQAE